MTTELVLFIIVGGLAVAFAALMLLSENAVHSALFLIGTMFCIAFLFLLLNAPFLAMIQISVYAGAIMVLFLFVIMLLGAEKLTPGNPGVDEGNKRRYSWFTPLAVVLAVSLVFAIGIPLIASNLSTQEIPGPQPMLRVVNAQVGEEVVNVTANDIPLATSLEQGQYTGFADLPPGDYTLTISYGNPTASAEIVPSQALETQLLPGTAHTLVIYGDNAPSLALIPDDLSTVTVERSARYTVFNGSTAPVSLVDFGAVDVADDTRVLIADIPPGELTEAITHVEGRADWAIINPANPDTPLVNLPELDVERNTSTTLIVTGERTTVEENVLPVVLPLAERARPSFGGPQAIGYRLFTDYLLPFQLLAVLLLASMVGVIVLTHRETSKERRQLGRRRVSRPLTNVIASQVGHDVTEPDAGEPAQLPETVGK
jgi:NADH:ubiquinone oxidoreductase subunit 6 (subunit J)